ncbi:MAG: adenosylcobinamide-GDP ribazoletransferase [Gammaproteobacteria bacterium]|nr:adenosylcobinamide-GDP ribazoletransferase [Gammaproteobacteria bacterium]
MNLKQELVLLQTALMFYTRIPVSSDLPYSEDLLNQSRKYFTTIGLIIGAFVVLSYWIANWFFPYYIAVIISVTAGILSTGAFHEDGFADSCDGLGGGWSKDQVLAIMKDSRIGTYGTIGLLLILMIKLAVLIELANQHFLLWSTIVLASHTVSRLQSSRQIRHYDYVQDVDKSKIKPIANLKLTPEAERFSILIALLPCAFLLFSSIAVVFWGLILSYFSASLFMRYCEKRIGGYTGDILGAIQQISEVVFLLCCVSVFH